MLQVGRPLLDLCHQPSHPAVGAAGLEPATPEYACRGLIVCALAAVPSVFSADEGGLVVRPYAVQILCAWSQDGGSMGRRCPDAAARAQAPTGPVATPDEPVSTRVGCVPGCSEKDSNEEPFWYAALVRACAE